MSKDNPFQRMWRFLTRAGDKEAFAAAHIANDTPAVRTVMLNALGEEEFEKLLPQPDPLNPETTWKPGTDPALWGDVLLLASRNNSSAEDAAKHIEAFHKAGGKFCNRPDEYGNRPMDYIFNDAYQAYALNKARGYCEDRAAIVTALVNTGIIFDPKNLRSLKWVVPQKTATTYTRYGNHVFPNKESVFDHKNAYYQGSTLRPDVLDQLREGMARGGTQSNVLHFKKSG